MQVVYILMSELNGYRNIVRVFNNREAAEEYKAQVKSEWKYNRHSFWVSEYPIYESGESL